MAAFQLLGVAVGWQIYALTGRALDLGLVGLAQFLPMLVLSLPAGHFADQHDRRRIASTCQALSAGCAVVLLLASLGGFLSRELVLGLMLLLGACRAFEQPSATAVLPMLVPPSALQQSVALSTSSFQLAATLGPALGGVLYAISPAAPYAAAALCFVTAAISVRALVLLHPPAPRHTPGLRAVFGGIGFIWREKVILGAISLDLFTVLLGGATALLPIFARDILHTGSWGMGILRACPALGAVAGSMWLARHPLRRPIGRTMFAAVGIYGLATLAFALSANFLLSMACLVVVGCADVVSVVIRASLVQTRTPEATLGRVAAVAGLFTGTSNQLGEFESGVTAALLGAVGSVVLGGFGTLAICGLWMLLFPALRRANRMAG